MFTFFAVFPCKFSWTDAEVFLVCKSTQTCCVVKTRVTGTRVLMRTKCTQLQLWSVNENVCGLKESERINFAGCPFFENVFLRKSYQTTSNSWNPPHDGTVWDYKIWGRNKKRRASHKIPPLLLFVRVLALHVWKKKETAASLRSYYLSFKLQELPETEYESLTSVPV